MQMIQIFCPACKRSNEASELNCVYCGALLDYSPESHTSTASMGSSTNTPVRADDIEYIQQLRAPEQGIGIYLDDYFNPVAIELRLEFTLGRKRPETSVENLIDLTPYGGYENGVSQKHALIRKTSTGYEILDLGSTNGTWLDKKRLMPNQPYPLASGTQVHLGRLCLSFVYKLQR
jgi:hypothetical protein